MKVLNDIDIESKYVYAIELILWSSTNGFEIQENYCTYYYTQCGVHDPHKLHVWLYENGYLRNANLEESLQLYSAIELKNIAAEYNCKKSGKKAEIAHRIALAMDDSDKQKYTNRNLLFLTQKGLDFYTKNYDLVKLHQDGNTSFAEYFPYRNSTSFEENAIRLYDSKLKTYISQKNYAGLSLCYQKLHVLYAAINEPDLSMLYILYVLYLSVNCANSYSFFFDTTLISANGITGMKKRIMSDYCILSQYECKEVNAYSTYYTESMVDEIYQSGILPYYLMDKNTFKILVNDIITNISINRDYYLSIIANNYEKLITYRPEKKSKPQGLLARIFKRE